MTKTFLLLGSTILAVALAGCGSANGSSAGARPSAAEDQGVKFAQCMRQHGIPMEDPKPGTGVTLNLDRSNAGKVQAAQKACVKYAPVRSTDPKQQAADLDRLTKLAQCLRRNGIPVEDPKPGKPFAIKSLKGNAAKTDQVMKTCQAEAGMPEAGGLPAGAAHGSTELGSKG